MENPPRTPASIFERALGLRSNTPFEFNLERWRALKSCGLFGNLSATAATDNNGKAVVVVSGFELPSITFAPEVSAGLSGFEPDIAGGLSFVDKNFMGLGQRLSILLSKKEAENRITDIAKVVGDSGLLFPHVAIEWQDFCIGKAPRVAIKYEEDMMREVTADIEQVGHDYGKKWEGDTLDSSLLESLASKAHGRLSRLSVTFKEAGWVKLPFLKCDEEIQMDVGLEPYQMRIRKDKSDAIKLSGATLSTSLVGRVGRCKAYCDYGQSQVLRDQPLSFIQVYFIFQ